MTDPSFIVEVGPGRTQGADFAQLPALAHRLGVSFRDATPPRHLALQGAGGVRLHALDWGGDGAPALFLHGGQLTAQTWDYVCLGLRGRARAIALDLRGHGDSDRGEDYTFDSHVADIGAALDAPAWPRALLAKVEEMVIAAERVVGPCLVVRGGRSEVFSDEAAARFAARFANGEWIAVPHAGHNVQEDNPAGLIAALSRFWSQPVLT